MSADSAKLKAMLEARKQRKELAAQKYAQIPVGIRSAIAKKAEVENVRLTDLGAADVRKLKAAAKEMQTVVMRAWMCLLEADVTETVRTK